MSPFLVSGVAAETTSRNLGFEISHLEEESYQVCNDGRQPCLEALKPRHLASLKLGTLHLHRGTSSLNMRRDQRRLISSRNFSGSIADGVPVCIMWTLKLRMSLEIRLRFKL